MSNIVTIHEWAVRGENVRTWTGPVMPLLVVGDWFFDNETESWFRVERVAYKKRTTKSFGIERSEWIRALYVAAETLT